MSSISSHKLLGILNIQSQANLVTMVISLTYISKRVRYIIHDGNSENFRGIGAGFPALLLVRIFLA